jgi:hypothetical protein
MSKALDRLKYEVAFNSICCAIKEKNIDSRNIFETHVEVCKGFFENIVDGIDSLTKGEYHLVEKLESIVNIFGYDKISTNNIDNISLDIKKTMKNLKSLKENPAVFYNSNESERLYNVFRKIKELYSNEVNFFEFA